jgi:AraC family transcriptional regulator, transcriptional activator FtrA
MSASRRGHRVAIAVTAGVPLFELAVPAEVFGRPRAHFDVPWWYHAQLCAAEPGDICVAAGLLLQTSAGLDELVRADTVIVPACADDQPDPPPALLEALREARQRGARIASICTGAFTLAAAGLLDGRTATTHWMHAAELRRRWPKVRIDPNVLYTHDDGIFTSAGGSAGIDLCLHIVARDHGTRVANSLARRLVVPPHRDGGQAQFIDLAIPTASPAPIAAVQDWARARLHEPLTVDDLARRAAMSPRTFARTFKAATATTPIQWLLHERIRLARELLETTDCTIDTIAARTGFGSSHQLRLHFTRFTEVTPHQYRTTFHFSGR